ncbi:MAG: 6-bladed beta-propeller [bacterium]
MFNLKIYFIATIVAVSVFTIVGAGACRKSPPEDLVNSETVGTSRSGKPSAITYVFAGEWGKSGGGEGEFNHPYALDVAADGTVYVADLLDCRLQYFTPAGSFLGKWGTKGKGPGRFADPIGIAVGPDGKVYVADRSNHRVQYFTPNGSFVGEWGGEGSGLGQFDVPVDVAVSREGRVYVADADNWRIQYFTSSGSYLGEWGGEEQFDFSHDDVCNLRLPLAVAVAPKGDVYTLEMGMSIVKRFDESGSFLGSWGKEGTGNGEFAGPAGLAVGPTGDVFVADPDRLQRFTAEGSFLNAWGSSGSRPGKFEFPSGVAVAPDGTVYVADTLNYRIQYFRPVAAEDK